MTTRKRKSPEKKPQRKAPGLASRAATAAGGVVVRHPSLLGGCVAFTVIFSFVSANALWYQPGEHPHPFFKTRDAASPDALTGLRPLEKTEGETTVFKIERPGDTETASIDPAAAAGTAGPAPAAPVSALVMDVQNELIRRGLYNGAADGRTGPRTVAAILFFQETIGMTEDGNASQELLAALKTDALGASAVPLQRPTATTTATAGKAKAVEVDPVAAAILAADTKAPALKPKAELAALASDAEMILNIQRGLNHLAYQNVSIDGVAGGQTRAAIRAFEKHYRLPETGMPNVDVVKKMKEIGAL